MPVIPVILIVGAIAAVAAAGITTYAAVRTSQAQADQAEAEAGFREAEAIQAQKSAEYESANIRMAAAFDEQQARRRLRVILSTNSALAASSGLDPSSGSPNIAELENVKQAEIEALNIRRSGAVSSSAREYEGRLAAQERTFAAGIQRYQGQLFKQQIPFQIASGITQAAGSGASVLSQWYTPTARASSPAPIRVSSGQIYGR